MTTDTFTITIHMVSSLDGMIAKKDNTVSWFDTPDFYEKGVGEPNVEEFLKTIDCYVMGSHTYEHAVALSKSYGWAYGDTPTIVLTKRNLTVDRPTVELYADDLETLVNVRLKPAFKNVWVVGGTTLANAFISRNLAHEIRLSIIPIILGDGIPFFKNIEREYPLHLKDVTAYKSGMVELRYEMQKQLNLNL